MNQNALTFTHAQAKLTTKIWFDTIEDDHTSMISLRIFIELAAF